MLDHLAGQNLIEWGVASRPVAGETEIGDQSLIKSFGGRALVAVIDGLGHGPRAAQVAQMVVATLDEHAHEPVDVLVQRCHMALKGSRGVVMSLAAFDASAMKLTWLGVGNVYGVLFRADGQTGRSYERLLLRGGIVGYNLPTLRPIVFSVLPGDTLVFVTDGIRSSFTDALTRDDRLSLPTEAADLNKRDVTETHPQQLAEQILSAYGRGTDDALVMIVRFAASRA